jgi:hypothetical protein
MGLLAKLRRLLFGEPEHRRMGSERGRRDDGVRPRAARRLRPGLPRIPDRRALARLLSGDPNTSALTWLEDPVRACAQGQLRGPHYTIQVRRKRSGAPRPILAPRPRLKAVQRVILREILDRLEPPPHAHGFVRGRSIRTHAAAHTGRAVVLQLDVRGFFSQFTFREVSGFFQQLGYGREVARSLAFLTTAPIRELLAPAGPDVAGVPRAALRAALRQAPYGSYHPCLPQGAPTSPALANHLCARLDVRLAALASRFGATYTRYADDLCFSGDGEFRRALRRFIPLARRIMQQERLPAVDAKLRVARKGGQQRVTGLVVNERMSVPTREVRALRAILHNCARTGPTAQNLGGHPDFRAHLRGRVAHVVAIDPARGSKLLLALEAVDWEGA